MSSEMRIGIFAKKFGIPVSTVRYYIQLGILVPESRNGQYIFSDKCVQDMERVMEYRELRFSLLDIHELLTLQRKFTLSQPEDRNAYLALLYQQRERLIRALETNQQQEHLLKQLEREITPYSTAQ